MTRLLNSFRYVILLAALLPLSCATFLPPADKASKLDDKNSIIFGKVELFINDKPIDISARGFLDPDPVVISHMSRYGSDASLNKNRFMPGEYAFRSHPSKDWYFSRAIPPGRYYFAMFSYLWIFESEPAFDLRTYTRTKTPYLMTFEVSTNQAVYIGTLRHNFHTTRDNWFSVKGTVSIDSTNEFEETRKWLLKSNPQFESNIVENPLQIRTPSCFAPGASGK